MNIFMETEDYVKGLSVDSVIEAELEFFKVMKAIRKRLGAKQYLLDQYVKKTLGAINHHLSYEHANVGFEECGSLRRICTEVLNGCGDKSHPMYSAVKGQIEKYRVKFQEPETLRAVAFTVVFGEFLKVSTEQFIQGEADELEAIVDNLKQQELFDTISVIVGEQEMEHLNFAIKRRFLLVPAANNYLQGLSNDYLYSFLHRDKETERHVFQILLDENTDAARGCQ